MLTQEKLAKELSEKKYRSLKKIAKTEQTLLVLVLYKTLQVGGQFSLEKQKFLAEKLAKQNVSKLLIFVE